MWETWTTAKTYHRLPSEVFEPDETEWQHGGEYGPILKFSLNAAVTWFGITIENALNERVKVTVGKETHFNPRYTLTRLLHQDFRLPRPAPKPEDSPNPWAALMAWAGKKNSGIKRYRYVPPV